MHVPHDHLVTDVLATTSSSSSKSQPQRVVLHQPLCLCQSPCCFWPHTLSADGAWQKEHMPPPVWFDDHTSQWDLTSDNPPFPRHWESFIGCPLPLSCTSRRQENVINLRTILVNQRRDKGVSGCVVFRTIMGLSHAANLLDSLMGTRLEKAQCVKLPLPWTI